VFYIFVPEERSIFDAPDPPKTTMEALTQRHNKYKNAAASAKEENNGGKSRRMGRIAKVSSLLNGLYYMKVLVLS